MNSTFFERVHGFLNNTSVSHSTEWPEGVWREKSGVTPASISSHFSIGVNSMAAVGPKLEPPLTFQLGCAPSSRIATGSLSTSRAACAHALAAQRHTPMIHESLAMIVSILVARQQSCRVENEGQFRSHVNKRREQWIQQAHRGERDTHGVNRERSIEILEKHAATPARGLDGFHETPQIVADQQHVGAGVSHFRAAA